LIRRQRAAVQRHRCWCCQRLFSLFSLVRGHACGLQDQTDRPTILWQAGTIFTGESIPSL
jgi:hypothetical protein